MTRGTFITIDGTDGSGKKTHVTLLAERLKHEGYPVRVVDFPRYGNPSAHFVERYLRKDYGSPNDVGPYRASIFYAVDRYDASFELDQWLEAGDIVLSNRYVSSNMGHQAGKIADPKERDRYLEWIAHLEYEIFGVPRPDVHVLLYLPPEIGQANVDKKDASDRTYVGGKKRDAHEEDIDHLRNASEAYLYVAKKFGWVVIDCARDGVHRPEEDVHEELYARLLGEGVFKRMDQ